MPDALPDTGDEHVHTVLVVSKTHLDVGFTDTAAAVRRRYLEEFFPRAVETADALRRRGGDERLCWTTGSWILTEVLRDGDEAVRSAVHDAVGRGDLAWHAMPFTTHTELLDESLLAHGLSTSARLDERFGRRTRSAKLTDVPGHTRGLVPALAAAGVDLLHVGVNPAWPAPDVPVRFRWRHPGGAEVSVMYQPGSYGDVQVVPGTGVAVAVVMTGDNLGPPGVDDVVATWADLRGRFPRAELRAAALDDVASVVRQVASDLPVVTSEVGDPWLHGAASDPVKLAGYLSLRRLRSRWLDDGAVPASDPALLASSDLLLQVAEHTWGLDQKTWWPETGHWSPSALAEVRDRDDTRRFEASWQEQRSLLDRAVAALSDGGRPELAVQARAALDTATTASTTASGPALADGWEEVEPSAPVELAGWTLEPAADGSLVGLRAPGGVDLATPGCRLGALRHRSWEAGEIDEWFAATCPDVSEDDRGWATWDVTKPGLASSGAIGREWVPSLDSVRRLVDGTAERLAMLVTFDSEAVESAGAPPRACIVHEVTVSAGDASADGTGAAELRSTLTWWGRPAARWPATTWWDWSPTVTNPPAWRMLKLGGPVDPLDVVSRGGVLHAVDALVHPDVVLDLLDAPLVLPLRDDSPVGVPRQGGRGPVLGWRMCLADNRWGTNFPMWVDGDASFRVAVRPRGTEPA